MLLLLLHCARAGSNFRCLKLSMPHRHAMLSTAKSESVALVVTIAMHTRTLTTAAVLIAIAAVIVLGAAVVKAVKRGGSGATRAFRGCGSSTITCTDQNSSTSCSGVVAAATVTAAAAAVAVVDHLWHLWWPVNCVLRSCMCLISRCYYCEAACV
jgi:hypothetical protein